MTFTSLKRNHLRYIMFRLKTGQTRKSARLTGKDLKILLAGWGHDVSVARARKLLAEIKSHYEAQIYFTGWENFAAEVTSRKTGAVRGTNKSWDIGMVDGDGSPEARLKNIARMVNRPHKWFLFGPAYTEVISTRGLDIMSPAGSIISSAKACCQTVRSCAISGFTPTQAAKAANLITAVFTNRRTKFVLREIQFQQDRGPVHPHFHCFPHQL